MNKCYHYKMKITKYVLPLKEIRSGENNFTIKKLYICEKCKKEFEIYLIDSTNHKKLLELKFPILIDI